MSKVIPLFKHGVHPSYKAMIDGMDKLELLEEMVRFQEERTRVGYLTLDLILRGRVLFSALEKMAETPELRLLTGSYRRYLDIELKKVQNAREST